MRRYIKIFKCLLLGHFYLLAVENTMGKRKSDGRLVFTMQCHRCNKVKFYNSPI